MKRIFHRSEMQKMLAQRNGYLILAVGGLLLAIIQTVVIFLMVGRERVVIVPPTIEKSFWVSKNHVSTEYLSEMTAFFANLRLNVTADNASFQRETLLRYTDPAYYNHLKTQLVNEEDRIKENHINIAFYPVNIKIDNKALKAIVEGDLKSFIGETALPGKRVSYQIKYRFYSGRLLIHSFEEVKHA